MILFKNLEEKYIEDAVRLAVSEYERECISCPQLIKEKFGLAIKEIVETLFQNGLGKIALIEDKLIGYLAFTGPWDGFFGNVKGVFSPLGGSAFGGEDRAKLASMLFEEASKEMAAEGIYTFAVSRYAHDEEVGRSFVMNGFGIRCSDAILRVKDRHIVDAKDDRITCHELYGEDKKQIEELKKGLTRHLCNAPTFFPTDLAEFANWFEREEIRVFAAKMDGKVIGYMALTKEGETFVSESPNIYNICGAFVEADYRKRGVAQQLAEYLCQICEKEQMEYLGVDCETMNPTALRFWGKYFQNYTYSYVRRIDERVTGYDQYLKERWGR